MSAKYAAADWSWEAHPNPAAALRERPFEGPAAARTGIPRRRCPPL